MAKIKLTISYDGRNYYGWQRQDDLPSIQEELEKACTKLFGRKVSVQGAGRTDARVHALGQCGVLDIETPIPVGKIPSALNNLLPTDIVITDAQQVAQDFHPRYWAKSKTYHYQVLSAKYPVPQLHHYAYFVHQPLNVEAMTEGAKYFIGSHDFEAFCSAQNTKEVTIRTINTLSISQDGQIITFEICGDGFLYNMVRIIIGTLIDVGIGRLQPSDVREIIVSKNRLKAGITAPACGLTMYCVEY